MKGGAVVAATAVAAPFVITGAHAQAEQRVVFACNGGSTQTLYESKIIPSFTKQTGIKVTYVSGQPADHIAKMRAAGGGTGIDTIWLGGAITYLAIDEGFLTAFDQSLVPNAAHLNPKFKGEPELFYIASSGNCLIYNKKVFDAKGWGPPSDWLDLWDPRFAGHTGMYGMESTGGLEMLMSVARQLSGDYRKMDAAFAKFKELSKTIYQFFPTAGAWETAFQQGEVWLGVNSYTRAIQLTQAGMPIGVAFPKTGFPSHELPVGLVKGAANAKNAHAWANHLLSEEAQAIIATDLGYSPTVTGVKIPDNMKALYPDPDLIWPVDWRELSKEFDAIVKRWQREVER